jgi:catechol 2,3-dioxygenase-like lactoylglutathione lyase family enzyme
VVDQSITHVALVVDDYDEAILFFTTKLKFELVDDTYVPEQDKRWVLVAPKGSGGTNLLLARASNDRQRAAVGHQTGGRVSFFLRTDDFWRDYRDMVAAGVKFVRKPRAEVYGTVAVFEDLYGNLWDLLGPRASDSVGLPDR